MPLVSVVIPTSRGGPYLRESVASVQTQTIDDWEVIIIADGIDEDLSDLESDPRVRVFRQRRRGVCIARNIGVDLATSDLVAFLDDDDRILPDRLRAQAAVMTSDETVGLCHSQARIIDRDGNIVPNAGEGARASTYEEYLRLDGLSMIGASMVRKSVFVELGGFNPLFRVGEDFDLILRFSRESKVVFMPEVLLEYRHHDTNSWTRTTPSSGQEIKIILAMHQMAAMDHGESENLRMIRKGMKSVLPARAHLALARANNARQAHHYVRAVAAFGQAFLIAPRASVRMVTRTLRRQRN
jgi:glycosyltransferase involved in cell wall biosynthesis